MHKIRHIILKHTTTHIHCSLSLSPASPLIHTSILASVFSVILSPSLCTYPPFPCTPTHPHIPSHSCIQKRGGGERGDEVRGVCEGNRVRSGEQEKPPTPAESTALFPHHRWLASIAPSIHPYCPGSLVFLLSSLLRPSHPSSSLFLLKETVQPTMKMFSLFSTKSEIPSKP